MVQLYPTIGWEIKCHPVSNCLTQTMPAQVLRARPKVVTSRICTRRGLGHYVEYASAAHCPWCQGCQCLEWLRFRPHPFSRPLHGNPPNSRETSQADYQQMPPLVLCWGRYTWGVAHQPCYRLLVALLLHAQQAQRHLSSANQQHRRRAIRRGWASWPPQFETKTWNQVISQDGNQKISLANDMIMLHPWCFNLEPENQPLAKEIPFGNLYFQVPR